MQLKPSYIKLVQTTAISFSARRRAVQRATVILLILMAFNDISVYQMHSDASRSKGRE